MVGLRDDSESPIFNRKFSGKREELTMVPNGDQGNGKYKIHRIIPTRSMTCIVSYVTSPSCIWLKPFNHITEKLKVTNLESLERDTLCSLKRYVLAPLCDGVYARARIISKKQFTEPGKRTPTFFSRVHFIDEGYCRWVGDDCLAKMDEVLSFYPYQAVATALFRVSPKENRWTESDIRLLRCILREYDTFHAKVIITKTPITDYRDYLRVDLYGKVDNDKNPLVAIAPDFFRQGLGSYTYDRKIFDGLDQKLFQADDDEKEFSIDIYKHIKTWERKFPDVNPIVKDENISEAEKDWFKDVDEGSSFGPRKLLTYKDDFRQFLFDEGYLDGEGELYVNVEGAHTHSPYEFYARFLRRPPSKVETLEDDPMILADNILKKLAEELNNFYGLGTNRRMISAEEVKRELDGKRSVYGVVEVLNDLSRFTGCWQRVEILGVKEDNPGYYAKVRYIDAGGGAIVLLSSVLKLHSKFLSWPPLCFQMCVCDLGPYNNEDEWPEKAKKFFARELRDDVPITVEFRDFSRGDSHESGYNCPALFRPNVVMVSDLKVEGTMRHGTIEERLIRNGYAKRKQGYYKGECSYGVH